MTAIVCNKSKGLQRIDIRVCAAKCKRKCEAYKQATDKQEKLFEVEK